MLRKTLRRLMPKPEFFREHKHLQFLGHALHDPNLFHLNRRSASGAMAVGLFFAFVPMPFQMIAAAAAAILVRVNLPISCALVWLTNPLTMGPIFFACYKLGSWVTGRHLDHSDSLFQWNGLSEFFSQLSQLGLPFIIGCLLAGLASAGLGYASMRLLWRWSVVQHLAQRKKRRLAAG